MIPVVWFSDQPGIDHRGYWDQEWVEAIMAGRAWRAPHLPDFEHHFGFDTVADGGGIIVVVPARWHAGQADRIAAELDRFAWALIVLTGDEEGVFPAATLDGPNRCVWIQTPGPDAYRNGCVRYLGDGWRPGTRQLLPAMRDEAGRRELGWFFSGQVNNRNREQAAAVLRARRDRQGDGILRLTRIFGSGMNQDEYLRHLVSAKVAPCPGGTFTPDTFRVFEALEAGCVPVVDGDPGYWQRIFWVAGFKLPPFPIIAGWDEFDTAADSILGRWPASANRVGAWWSQAKRDTATEFVDCLHDLGGVPGTVNLRPDDDITVIIPTSPIPAHPDVAIIAETVNSVRERLPTAEILIACDGVRPEQTARTRAYEDYQRRLLWAAHHEWANVAVFRSEEWKHQGLLIRDLLDAVRTRLLLFVEHDTPLVGDIPFPALAEAIKTGPANVIRLHHEASVLEPHRHLMLTTIPEDVRGAPLLRTAQWSQRPHLASVGWYRDLLDRAVGRESRTMIEDVVYGMCVTDWREHRSVGWDHWRLWMYAPDGDMKRSTHLDGRADADKYPMRFRYDRDPPFGAPAPYDPEPAGCPCLD